MSEIILALIGRPGMPGPERVQRFLACKGLRLPLEDPGVFFGDHAGLTALAGEVDAGQPLIELSDGTHLVGVSAIQMFVEEVLPEPVLLGRTALERASVEMWQRTIENRVMSSLGVYAYHSYLNVPSENGAEASYRNASWGQRNLEDFLSVLDEFDARLGEVQMIAGFEFSAADITLLSSLDFAESLEIQIPERFANLHRWRLAAAQHLHRVGRSRENPVDVSATDAGSGETPQFVSEDVRGGEKRIAVVGLDGRYRFGNQHLLDVHGLTAGQLRGLHLGDVTGREFYESVVRRSIVKCVRTGETIRRRALVPYPSGEKRYVDVEYAPWLNDQGEIDAVVLTIEDVHRYRFLADRPGVEPSTERVQLLDAVFGSVRERVIVLDDSGHWIYANQPTLDLYGVSLQRIVGHHLSEWVGSRYFDNVIYPAIAAGFRGENGCIESGYYSPAGEWVEVVFDYSAYHERNGEISGVVMQTRQVSDDPIVVDQHTRPFDLHRLRFVSRILGSSASDQISVLDSKFRFLHVNDAATRRWDIPASQFLGQHVSDVVGEEFYKTRLAKPLEACLKGQYVHVWVNDVLGDGSVHTVRLELFPYSEQPGQTAIQAVMLKVHGVQEQTAIANGANASENAIAKG